MSVSFFVFSGRTHGASMMIEIVHGLDFVMLQP